MEHFYQNTTGEDWFDYQEIYSQMISYFPDYAHFVEIGTWKGRSAAYMGVEIINSGKNIKFDCVDTWGGSEEHIDPNSYFYHPQILEDKNWLFNEFTKNILPVRHIINPIRKPSLETVYQYKDRSLDFVFIDAAHDYFNVKNDILAWYPKIKKGGFIGGHDYAGNFPGVNQAVEEIFGMLDSINGSWLYHKP